MNTPKGHTMTKQEAKALTLEVWRYFRDHTEIDCKTKLPIELYRKIENLSNTCPLCHVLESECCKCPLKQCEYDSLYYRWAFPSVYTRNKRKLATVSECIKMRRRAAAGIVRKVEKWDAEAEISIVKNQEAV